MQRGMAGMFGRGWCLGHANCICRAPFHVKDRAAVDARVRGTLVDPSAMTSMRRAVFEAGFDPGVQRLTDSEVIEHFAQLVACGGLQLCGGVERRPLLPLRRRVAATPASVAITPSQLRGLASRDVTHWVEYQVVDRAGKPLSGIPYRFVDPGGAEEKGKLGAAGRVRRDGCEPGPYLLELGELTEAFWQVGGRRASAPLAASSELTLVVNTRALEPGTSGSFEIFHFCDEEPGRAIGSVSGALGADERITATFRYEPPEGIGRRSELVFSCMVGKLWIKSPPIALLHPRLVHPRWSTSVAQVGDEVELQVGCPGLADGEAVQFEIHRADTDAVCATLDGVVRDASSSVTWKTVDPDPETAESELHFIARCGGQEAQSAALTLHDRVEFAFVDDAGQPLAFLPVALVYRDGTRRVFTTDAGGMLRLTDPRARNARCSVAGADEDDVAVIDETPL